MTQAHPPETCPICSGPLCVDEEYMLSKFGSAYTALPWREWSFYCEGDCEEAGLWAEFERIAREGGKPVTTDNGARFDHWCILELMGHVRLAGRVTEESHFGVALGRIDIPNGDGYTTQYFGGSSVYRITPTTEEVARLVAVGSQPEPVHRWELPAPKVPTAVAHAATGWSQDSPSALDDAMIEDRELDEDDGEGDLCEDDSEGDLSGGDEAEFEAARESWR